MISDNDKSRICSLYEQNNSIKKIRSITGVSEPTISKILKERNIEIKKHNYQKIILDTVEINCLYQSGMSTYQIAAKYNCSDETIRKIIETMRPSHERNILSDESKNKIGKKSALNWQKQSYRQVVIAGKDDKYFENLIEKSKENYSRTLGIWIKDAENHKTIAEAAREIWKDREYRQKQAVYFQERGERLSAASKKALTDPEKRKAWIDKIRKNNASRDTNGWVSSSQKQLYYILNDSDITFFEEGQETRVGPFYMVDCIIPAQQRMQKPLIIEVNGEYWHSLPHVAVKDRQKATYIKNNTEYDLLTIDELELNNFEQVKSKLSGFGLDVTIIESSVSNIRIDIITEIEAKMLYSIFHYSSTIRKGATTFGAFVNNKLVAAISYTYPLRSSSAQRLGLELKEVMEISRLARKTNFICNNFASWFISKTSKMLPKTVRCLISFSDQTYGHTGTVYKAANFIEDGCISPDYSYVSVNGQYHKKTIWDRSKRMKMSEEEYAEKHGLRKIFGGPKTRWILKLK